MTMEILYQTTGNFMMNLTGIFSLTTIFGCYLIAVSQGNVPVWLPMISDCAVDPPESYFFRFGIITSAALLNVNAIMMLCYRKASQFQAEGNGITIFDQVAYGFALTGSIGLALVGSINEKENMSLHGASAGTFFGCFLIYMLLVTVRLCQDTKPSNKSLRIKVVLFLVALGSLVTLLVYGQIGWSKEATEIAVCEWLGTISIILFCYSFKYEFGKSLFISADLQPANCQPESAQPTVVYVPTYIPVPVAYPAPSFKSPV